MAKRTGKTTAPPSAAVTIRVGAGLTHKATEVWNISLGGVFIAMGEPLKFGEEASFEFALGPGTPTVRCKGFVIWTTREAPEKANGKKGVGVRLMDLAVADMRNIADVVGRGL